MIRKYKAWRLNRLNKKLVQHWWDDGCPRCAGGLTCLYAENLKRKIYG